MSGSPHDAAADTALLLAALGATDELFGGYAHHADTCSKIATEAVLAVEQLIDGPMSVKARTAGTHRLDVEATTAQARQRATGTASV